MSKPPKQPSRSIPVKIQPPKKPQKPHETWKQVDRDSAAAERAKRR
jgi:hypothetical protein